MTTPPRAPAAPKPPDPGYVVQRGWLDRARGQVVQVRLLDGKGVKGQLVGHDNYCLSVKLEAASDPILIFKHAIAYLALATDKTPTA